MLQFSKREIHVAGVPLILLEAGRGKPLLVLHDELGPTEPRSWHARLAEHHRIIIPIHPGFRTPRIKWIRGVRDVAALYGAMLRQEKLTGCDAIGFSYGGWIAAEMAVNNPGNFQSLVLVAPFGVKPQQGFIKDMFPLPSFDYLQSSVADPAGTVELKGLYGAERPEQIEAWEDARTECARLGWQPYMHNQNLPDLLRVVEDLPTVIVWGTEDAILPRDAAEIYARSIPGAQLQIIEGVGHRPEIEAPEAFLRAVSRVMTSPVAA